MNCAETDRLLDAYVYGELDLAHHAEVEAHLRSCAACASAADSAGARKEALRERLTRFTASAALADRVRQSLEIPGVTSPAGTARRLRIFWSGAGLAAGLAASLMVGFVWGGARDRSRRVVDEAAADHVRSLMADHLTDVASSDRHTVKPWFAGKLGFSPTVIDLADAGFPLVGGRLEEIDRQEAAALVYRRRQHVINLLIWPAEPRRVDPGSGRRSGYQTNAWVEDGFNFLAVSEIPADELAEFAGLLRSRTP